MSFDFGLSFRNTLPYVTDPSYVAAVLFELFPHTYTNGQGNTLPAGWNAASGAVPCLFSTLPMLVLHLGNHPKS